MPAGKQQKAAEHLHREMQASIEAGAIVGRIYDALLAAYGAGVSADDLRQLNILCVRLVFCLYAEDAGIFPRHNQFHDYLAQFPAADMRDQLMRVFQTLNTPAGQRSRFMRADLERAAQGILDARSRYPDSSLADLYDPTLMPHDLLEAHRATDRAVMCAYGFDAKMAEAACVARLFERYAALNA